MGEPACGMDGIGGGNHGAFRAPILRPLSLRFLLCFSRALRAVVARVPDLLGRRFAVVKRAAGADARAEVGRDGVGDGGVIGGDGDGGGDVDRDGCDSKKGESGLGGRTGIRASSFGRGAWFGNSQEFTLDVFGVFAGFRVGFRVGFRAVAGVSVVGVV